MNEHGERQNLQSPNPRNPRQAPRFHENSREATKPRNKEEESRKLADDGAALRDFATSRLRDFATSRLRDFAASRETLNVEE